MLFWNHEEDIAVVVVGERYGELGDVDVDMEDSDTIKELRFVGGSVGCKSRRCRRLRNRRRRVRHMRMSPGG